MPAEARSAGSRRSCCWRTGPAAVPQHHFTGDRDDARPRRALAGFDDIPTLRDVYPPLTTVRLPLKRLGETAARLVLREAAPAQPRVVPVPGEVVLRDSTRPRPPAAR